MGKAVGGDDDDGDDGIPGCSHSPEPLAPVPALPVLEQAELGPNWGEIKSVLSPRAWRKFPVSPSVFLLSASGGF